VIWCNAESIAAHMVNYFPFWNCSIKKLPSPTVRLDLLSVYADAAVAVCRNTALRGNARAKHF